MRYSEDSDVGFILNLSRERISQALLQAMATETRATLPVTGWEASGEGAALQGQ